MSKSALHKDIFIEIKKTLNRFFSIFLIVALGVAFFAGVRATNPDMRLTADDYLDKNHLMDIAITGTLGFSDDDIDYLSNLNGVKTVEPSYMFHALSEKNGNQSAFQIFGTTENMNQFTVDKGRLPEGENECFVDNLLDYSIGDTITLSSGTDMDITTYLKQDTFTVVGVGSTSYFLSFDRGSTTIGDGSITGFLALSPEAFSLEYYTELYIEVEGSRELISHSQEYTDLVQTVTDSLDEISNERCDLRYESFTDESKQKIENAKADIANGERELQEKLDDALAQINDGEAKLNDGQQLLAQKEEELNDAKTKLETGRTTIESGKQALNEAQTQLDNAKSEIASKETQIEGAKLQLSIAEANLGYVKALYPSPFITIQEIESQIADGEAQLASAKAQVADGEAQLIDGKIQLENAQNELNSKTQELADGEAQLLEAENQINEGESQLLEAKNTLSDSESQLNDAKSQYDDGKAEGEAQLIDAKAQVVKAEDFLSNLTTPSWYISTRDSLPEYSGFGDNADRIGAIGKVFPAIFFLVAALVSLTTMTRMVEEERIQIGTLKALGYNKFDIALKYIFYALSATFGGSIMGVLIGEKLFPIVIITAYKIMYPNMSSLQIPYNWQLAYLATGLAVLCTLVATAFACYKELLSSPSSLMRPAAPKQGKRVILERITFLWKNLSFSQKSTFRNLFRYKKRFFMTIFGIGSCMGLLIVGFGLRDSITHIGDLQYNQIQTYDAMVYLDTEAPNDDREGLIEYLNNSKYIEDKALVSLKSIDVTSDNGASASSAYICVGENLEASASNNNSSEASTLLDESSATDYSNIDDKNSFAKNSSATSSLDKYIRFRDRITGEEYSLNDDEVIITEQMANHLDVSAGDTITLQNGDDSSTAIQVVVSNVCENYLMHYVYMTESLYEKLYNKSPDFNVIFLSFTDSGISNTKKLGREMLDYESARSVVYVESRKATIENMLSALDIVIYVLIISAGLLAFVVLYNLNNININERKRELATIKVLGFFDNEVANYVYRENVFLTLIGILLGLIIGKFLHQFVITTVEIDLVMFGRNVEPLSYLYSALLTCGFSAFVNYVMYFKLKKIDMVESLKSIE